MVHTTMQPTNYDTESKKVLAAHKKRMDDFYKSFPLVQYYAEKHLTMLIPDVWDNMVRDLDNALPHTRRSCPDTPMRKQEYIN